MALSYDIGPLQTAPGASVGPLRNAGALTGAISVNAKLGTGVAETLTASLSRTIGSELGILATTHAAAALSVSPGVELGILAAVLRTIPTSHTIGVELGLTAAESTTALPAAVIGVELGITAANTKQSSTSISPGVEMGLTAAELLTAPLSRTIGIELGITATAIIPGVVSATVGAKLGISATPKRLFPNSVTDGVELGLTAHITYPQSRTFGVELGVAAAQSSTAHLAITPGVRLGITAFATNSAPPTPPTTNQLFYFVIVNPGATYTSAPTITVTGGSGSGATFQALLGAAGTPQAGQIVGVATTNTGNGQYTAPLSVAVSGGGGSGAVISASLQQQASLQAAQQQPLQVRAEGYGVLTIETLVIPATTAQTPQQLLPPPIRQPWMQQTPAGAASQTGDTSQVAAKPWLTWLQSVYGAITGQQPSPSSTVEFLCPSVDETDSEWYGVGTIDGAMDPISFTATLTGQSRFGILAGVYEGQGGAGYSGATVLTLSGQGNSGYGAQLTAIIIGGTIVGVTVVQSGYGYQAPLSLVATDTGGGSGSVLIAELGRQWGVGDFILWADPTINAGVLAYEIDQITAITPISDSSATFTIARNAAGAPADQAQYGSPFVGHAGAQFYRLINKLFTASANSSPGPQVCKFPWDNMTVAAVTATLPGQTPVTINLAPTPYSLGTTTLNPLVNPPAPGLRTMNGAAYTNLGITGAIAVGQTSAARVSVQAHESIRTVYAKVTVAPTGPVPFGTDPNACIVIYVCYISPAGIVGLIDTLVIDTAMFNSYSASNVPDGRQMPFHSLWPFTAPNADWPPNRLPQCAGALTADGLLQLPITPSGASTVLFSPDGAIDIIVAQIGTTTPGSNLTVTVQT